MGNGKGRWYGEGRGERGERGLNVIKKGRGESMCLRENGEEGGG